MQDDEESQEFGERPSKSARKREADAAQDLGTRLIALKESELAALGLPEKLFAIIHRLLERLGPYEEFIGAVYLRALQPSSAQFHRSPASPW